MKKIFFLLVLFTAIITSASAQGGNQDPAARFRQMKERVKPQLIEKTKLTDAQAEKVLEVRFNSQSQMRGLRDLSEDDRKKKMAEMQVEIDKQFKAIPLTDDQVKSVNELFEEMRKNNQKQREGGKEKSN